MAIDPVAARRPGPPRRLALARRAAWVLPLAGALPAIAQVRGAPPALELARAALLLFAIGRAADRLGARFAPARDAAERAWVALLTAAGSVVLLTTLLGAAGHLARLPFFLAIALLWSTTELALSPRRPTPRVHGRLGRRAAIAALALASVLLVGELHAARRQPAGETAYDDVYYHLPAALVFDRFADLRTLRLGYGDPSTSFYPLAGELVSWSFLAPFDGSDLLARWSQLPAAIGLLLTAWLLAREAGATALAAAVTLPLVLSVRRLFPELALSAGNDLWAAFACTSAALALARFRRRPSAGEGTLLGLALGLLVATKYLALVFLPGLAAWALGLCLRLPRDRGHPPARRARALPYLCVALIAVALGGYVYLRNAVTMGNPVFPQPVHLFGFEILPGWPSTGLLARRAREAASLSFVGDLLHLGEMTSRPWRWLLLPVALLAPIAISAGRTPRGPRRRFATVLSLAPAGILVAYSFVLYEHRDVRQIAAVFPIAAAALVRSLDLMPGGVRLAALATTACVGAAAAIARQPDLSLAGVAVGLAIASGIALRRRAPRTAAIAGTAALAAVALGVAPFLADYPSSRLHHEPLGEALERETGGLPAVVAYVGGNRPYVFWGARLQNRVEIVPAVGGPDASYYRWGAPPPAARQRGGSLARWRANLEALEVEWVVCDRSGLDTPARRWLPRLGRRVERVLVSDQGEIWRVSRRSPTGDSVGGQSPSSEPMRARRSSSVGSGRAPAPRSATKTSSTAPPWARVRSTSESSTPRPEARNTSRAGATRSPGRGPALARSATVRATSAGVDPRSENQQTRSSTRSKKRW